MRNVGARFVDFSEALGSKNGHNLPEPWKTGGKKRLQSIEGIDSPGDAIPRTLFAELFEIR